ncbi:MAG: deoxyguanosinetriphosphate triphosphohydrolase [Eubacteriales bacterium]|nr:deoxyguanosinetriphosphate triphosphohydrolase [Eubacteriales bacterium]
MDECYRTRCEEIEAMTLGRFAKRSADTKGREYPLPPCPVRTPFVRDRDRIIHCKSFRRLKHKTQVFLSPVGDHYRTRLTHTLEVSQIARTISRALRLNEDLTEAIALGHDIGHTPFGHGGESVLNDLVPGGFEHNKQSRRVVEKLENGVGLNLTFEVRDGIENHKKNSNAATLEGHVVSFADRIAYINHDIDDAIRAGVLSQAQLPKSCVEVLGATHGERINSMILDVLHESYDKPAISMSDTVYAQFELLRDFMFQNVYLNHEAKREEDKAKSMIAALYRYHLQHVKELPSEFTKYLDEDGPERVTADYIACMTDRYAVQDYKNIFVPNDWI